MLNEKSGETSIWHHRYQTLKCPHAASFKYSDTVSLPIFSNLCEQYNKHVCDITLILKY